MRHLIQLNESKVFDIADIVELKTWANDYPYSVSTLKEDLEASLAGENEENEDDEGINAEEDQEKVSRSETYANQVFEELERRSNLLRDSYPFNISGNTISTTDVKNNSSYLFCLGLCFFDDINDDFRTVEFESIAKVAAEKYFCGSAIRIGSPWKLGQIQNYKQLLQLVADLIPDLGPPTRDAAPGKGDSGWDVVVVNNFPDNQFSRIIALGNCATGKTNWLTKGEETKPEYFWSFFTMPPTTYNPCVTFLAVPFMMTLDQKMRKQGHNAIAFDRLRLCSMASGTTVTVMEWLENHREEALKIPLI